MRYRAIMPLGCWSPPEVLYRTQYRMIPPREKEAGACIIIPCSVCFRLNPALSVRILANTSSMCSRDCRDALVYLNQTLELSPFGFHILPIWVWIRPSHFWIQEITFNSQTFTIYHLQSAPVDTGFSSIQLNTDQKSEKRLYLYFTCTIFLFHYSLNNIV